MKSIFEYQSLMSDLGFMVKEYHQTHFTSPFHFHDLYELALISKSYGKLYAGNKVMNFGDDDIFLFGPGFAHCFYNEKSFISSGEMAHAIVIFFKEDFLGKGFFLNSELAKTRELLEKSAFGIKVNKPNELMRGFFNEITKKKGIDALVLLLQLLNLLSNQKKSISLINTEISKAGITDSDSARLEPVLKYVIDNFKDELNSKVAASLACLNEAAFCRYFKSRTEQTFSQFVNTVRITHATRLLSLEELTISNICFECGFQNISYFNRQFKDIIGQTPLNYRKSLLYSDDNLIIPEEREEDLVS